MRKVLVFVYGLVCYSLFLATFLYAIGFVGNLFVPKSLDSMPTAPFATALLINAGLLGIFAVLGMMTIGGAYLPAAMFALLTALTTEPRRVSA